MRTAYCPRIYTSFCQPVESDFCRLEVSEAKDRELVTGGGPAGTGHYHMVC